MSYDYYAFISYSRKDKKAAGWLHRHLESYRYPAVLVAEEYRPENPKYLRKVFRDTSDLDVTQHNFTESIDRHIAGSRYLIVLCSPNSAKSVWVEREIVRFLETHDNNTQSIFPVILEGEVPECLSERLRLPEFLDRNIPTMIPDDASSRKEGWEHGFLQLVSCMLNVSTVKITDRFQKAKQAVLRRIIFGISAVLAVTVGLTVWALIAEHKAEIAEGKAKVAEAKARHEAKVAKIAEGKAKVAEAKAVAAEKVARHEAEVAKSSLDFVEKAFDAADASKSGNRDMTLLEFAEETSGKLETIKMPEVKLKVATMVLPLLSGMGDPKTALARMLLLLPEAKKQYPADSGDWADFNLKLADVYQSNGEYDRAIELYRQVLAIYRKQLGADHPDVAVALNNIGRACGRKGQYDKAIMYYEQSLAIYRKKLGNNHPNVATVLNNIGTAYQNKGFHDKAIKYYEQALAILRKKLGEDHPDTAMTLNNIGAVYARKGSYDKAIEYCEQALAIRRKKLGNDHPDVAMALYLIGGLYYRKGAYDRAIEYLEQALAIRRKKLGTGHSDTVETRKALQLARELKKKHGSK